MLARKKESQREVVNAIKLPESTWKKSENILVRKILKNACLRLFNLAASTFDILHHGQHANSVSLARRNQLKKN